MPQIIPFVVTAIVSVTSAVVAAGPLAVAAFNAANIIGAAALANEAFKAVQPSVKSSSTAIEWAADPNAPNRFAFGRVGGAGNIIHNATYGPDSMYVGFVGVMSASGPIKGWVGFRAEETPVTFDGSGKANSSYYANVMWLDRLNGTQPASRALASPSGLKSGASMPSWGASAKLSGKAAYMYTLAENSKQTAYKGKVPTGIHTIEGLYCYDPRFDSTFPGGSGSCRLNDPTTWVYSTNAYIHGLNWAIGRWEGLTSGAAGAPYSSMKVGGIGARPEAIDFAAYVEGANVFDENAWSCAAWPDADQGKAAVLDSFLQAGGGIYAERQGRISCMHRAAPRTSVATITTDDTAGTIEYDTTTSLLDRINTIRPEFWSEANNWQMVATDEVTSSVWRLEDGQGVALTKSKGMQYNYVPGSKQARELACLQIAHTREGIRGTAPLRHYLDLEVGDCIDFEVPEAVLNGQKVIILNVDPDLENDIINVTFASETDAKYPFAFGQTAAPPPAPSIVPGDPTVISGPLPGDWTVTPRPPATGGTQLPGFDLTGLVSNATATAMLVEYGPDPAGPWKQAYQGPPTVTNVPIDGVQPGAIYYIAVSYQRGQNFSQREVYGPYTAPGLVAGDVLSTSPTIVGLNDQITAAFGDIFDLDGLLSDARADIDAQGVEIAAARGGQPNLNSRIAQVNQARIDGDTANATAISLVQARTANTEADIIDLENAQAGEAIARAEAISQITARQIVRENKIVNSTGALGYTGWPGTYGARPPEVYPTSGASPTFGLSFDTGASGLTGGRYQTERFSVDGNAPYSFQAELSAYLITAGSVRAYVTYEDAAGNALTTHDVTASTSGGYVRLVKENFVTPAATARGVVNIDYAGASFSAGGYAGWRRLKLEPGPVCTTWTDDASTPALSASVTQQSLAIVDLENQQALAYFSQVAAASGGLPAFVELLSSTLGGRAALAGPVVALLNTISGGDPLVALQAIGGEVFFPRPIYIDLGTKRLIVGPGNGWVMWFGGQDKTAATATRTNGSFSLGDDGQVYLGAAALAPASPFTASAPTARVKTQVGGSGTITTATVPITVSGATGTVTYTWSPVFGEIDGMSCSNTSSPSPTFSANIAGVGRVQTIWAWTATDSGTGTTRAGQTYVTIQRDA